MKDPTITYLEIINQYKKAGTTKERNNCMFTLLCMIANNHLPHIESELSKSKAASIETSRKQEKFERRVMIGFGIIILSILFESQISIASIISELIKIF